jgi:NitT/TauT family transport system substrate-binding protein
MHVSTRRTFLTQVVAGTGALAIAPSVARGQAKKLRIGYLHTLAVDGQIWLAEHLGTWKKEGLEPEYREFTTGIELFQALIGGSIDVLATGAVISNFPARGQGKAFLINNIEYGTAQLWVRPDQGVTQVKDLKGKKIATTRGTTAHVFLHRALKSVGLDSTKDVELINQRMSEAVTSFIAGAVPAVALWVPFNVAVKSKVPGAKMLVDASAFYPEAAIIGGWAARNDLYEKDKDVLTRIVRAWIPANDFLVKQSAEAVPILQKTRYPNVPIDDLWEQYRAQKVFTAQDWVKLYQDGTVTKWLNQVTSFNVEVGAFTNPVPAEQYFDKSIYLGVMAATK